MKEKREYLVKKINLTSLVKFCNDNFKKQTGKEFKIPDGQNYTRRGCLPEYLGDIKIETDKSSGIPLYSLYKIIENEKVLDSN